MTRSPEIMPDWLEVELRQIVKLFVEGDYYGLERWSRGSRVPAKAMEQSIQEYGRTLAMPSDLRHACFGRMEVGEPAYWVSLPFCTKEEVRSDLEVQLTVYDPSKSGSQCRIEIDDILVP